jgi:uncharacterized membrane protein HdeD (DUF308 family)
MANDVIDFVLARLVISGLPGTDSWALGLLLCIDLVFGGTSLIAMALGGRNEALGCSARHECLRLSGHRS